MSSMLDVPARTYSLNVKFGRVSAGAKTITVPIKVSRDAMPTEKGETAVDLADDILRNRRLTVELTNEDDQKTLFPEHDNRVSVSCIVETAGLGISDEFSISMNVAVADLTEEQRDQIWHLAQREGRVVINDVSNKEKADSPHPDMRDDEGDPDKQTACGGNLFAAASKASTDATVRVLKHGDKPAVTEAQAQSLIDIGYGTVAAIVELRESVGESYVEKLANAPKMSKAAAKRLSEIVELSIAKDAEPAAEETPATLPLDGRLLCPDCGQIWDTLVADVDGKEQVIGEKAARDLDECPHCGSEKRPDVVRDERVDADGEFPREHCEALTLVELDGVKADLLLVQDEFRGWRVGVAIEDSETAEGASYGYLPAFDSPERRDRGAAIIFGKQEAIRELDELDHKQCSAAIRASMTQPTA